MLKFPKKGTSMLNRRMKILSFSALALGISLNAFAMEIDLQGGQPVINSSSSMSVKGVRIANYANPVTAEFSWDSSTNSLKLVDLIQEPNPDSVAGDWMIANDPGCSGSFQAPGKFTVNADGTCQTYIPCRWTLKDGHISIVWPSVPEWLYAGDFAQGVMGGKITDNTRPWGCWKATRSHSLMEILPPVFGGAMSPPQQ